MTTLSGKTALVTGSTSGIGLAIARALARQGANIMLNGFGDAALIDRLKKEIAAGGAKVEFNPADMAQPAQIEALVKDTAARLGSLDILVNNAGIQHVAPIDQFPPEKWDQVIAIDLSSAFHTTRLAVPAMRKTGWGRIVNVASAHGLVASPFKAAYVAAKHGVVGLTKVTALETAEENITCNAICPGYVWTPLVEAQIEGREVAWDPARGGDPRRASRAAAEQALRDRRGDRRADGLPHERSRGFDHRDGAAGRRRLDRSLKKSEECQACHRWRER